MSYGIYRVNTDELLKEWDKEHGRIPVWVAADKRDNRTCKQYDDRSKAQSDCDVLSDVLNFAVIVVNLENKQF